MNGEKIFLTDSNKSWIIPVVDVDGELGFELPDEILDQLSLSFGDTIIWENTGPGVWTLRKENNG